MVAGGGRLKATCGREDERLPILSSFRSLFNTDFKKMQELGGELTVYYESICTWSLIFRRLLVHFAGFNQVIETEFIVFSSEHQLRVKNDI